MTPETEDFDALRRLLKLKRHEQPPPGYFNEFSRQVLARVRADARAPERNLFDHASWEAPWLVRLLETLQFKPALAVTFGTAVCALLLGGVIFSETTEYTSATVFPGPQAQAAEPTFPIAANALGLGDPTTAAFGFHSTNELIQPGGSLFDQFRLNPQPVGFRSQGGGN